MSANNQVVDVPKVTREKWGCLFQFGDWRNFDAGPAWEKTIAFRAALTEDPDAREFICGSCASSTDLADPLTITGGSICPRCGGLYGSPIAHDAAIAKATGVQS